MIPQDQWPVHEAHCCPKHGCKYGDEGCPVVMGLTEKHNEYCEDCEYDSKHPDPLDLLEEWFKDRDDSDVWRLTASFRTMIKAVREKPLLVAEYGRKEGWWKK